MFICQSANVGLGLIFKVSSVGVRLFKTSRWTFFGRTKIKYLKLLEKVACAANPPHQILSALRISKCSKLLAKSILFVSRETSFGTSALIFKIVCSNHTIVWYNNTI